MQPNTTRTYLVGMLLNVKKLIEDLGGPSHVAGILGIERTTPYRWIKTNRLSGRVIANIKSAAPLFGRRIDIDGYFEEREHNENRRRARGRT